MQQKTEELIENFRTAAIYNNSLLHDDHAANEAEHEARQALLNAISPPSQNGWVKGNSDSECLPGRIFKSWTGEKWLITDYPMQEDGTYYIDLPQPPIKGE